jgi:ATP-binding cassette subfamily F protein uup
VTQTIASESNGLWKDYVGGYSDWERQRPTAVPAQEKASRQPAAKKQTATRGLSSAQDLPSVQDITSVQDLNSAQGQSAAKDRSTPTATSPAEKSAALTPKPRPGRLTSWEAKELEKIPSDIEQLETEQSELVEQMGNTDLYKSDPGRLGHIQNRLSEIETLIQQKMDRWELLEQKQAP